MKLESFDAAQKVALIRAVKDIVKDLNLIAVASMPIRRWIQSLHAVLPADVLCVHVWDSALARDQAKKFVEEAPKVLKEAASKEEAAKIKAELEKLGAKITVE